MLIAGLRAMVARRRRIALAVAVASTGAATFALRFLSLRDFANDHYMQLAWAQQLLLGAVPSRDFVDPGYPLTYVLSAAVQPIWPGPLSEAVLTIALLSISGAVTVLAVEAVTGSILVAATAGTFSVLIQPQLYNHFKFLVPAVALWLFARHEATPSRRRLAAVAVWTTAAFLFRHDLGLYVAAAIVAGLLAAHWRAPRTALSQIGWYVGVGLLSVLPYLVFLQWAEGIGEHLHDAVEFFAQETSPWETPWPDFQAFATSSVGTWNQSDSAALLFYLARLLVPFAAILLGPDPIRWTV